METTGRKKTFFHFHLCSSNSCHTSSPHLSNSCQQLIQLLPTTQQHLPQLIQLLPTTHPTPATTPANNSCNSCHNFCQQLIQLLPQLIQLLPTIHPTPATRLPSLTQSYHRCLFLLSYLQQGNTAIPSCTCIIAPYSTSTSLHPLFAAKNK